MTMNAHLADYLAAWRRDLPKIKDSLIATATTLLLWVLVEWLLGSLFSGYPGPIIDSLERALAFFMFGFCCAESAHAAAVARR